MLSIVLSKTDLKEAKIFVRKMDYHSMSLAELKQCAKNHSPKIKQYYIKSRVDLIRILSMNELPMEMIIEKKTIDELRNEARSRSLPNIWKLRRSELVDLLYPSSKQNNKNNDDGHKHDDPQESESK